MKNEKGLNVTSVVVGALSFLIIGIFHPVVIKGEYHFGRKIWPLFLVCGAALLAVALFVKKTVVACLLSITGFTCLWSIKELNEQEERVAKGWFPQNPRGKHHSKFKRGTKPL